MRCLPGVSAGEDRAVDRLDGDRFQRMLFLILDVAADAGDRAAGADARDQDVDFSAGVFPDLRAGGAKVDFRDWPGC